MQKYHWLMKGLSGAKFIAIFQVFSIKNIKTQPYICTVENKRKEHEFVRNSTDLAYNLYFVN